MCARIKGANREVSVEKLISDHCLFSSYEGQPRSGDRARFVGRFSGMHRALDGWMMAG